MLTTAKPLVIKLRTGLGVGILALTLSACGGTKWGFPYRADIQQGNWITSEQVTRLEKGMTREQVRFILGTPTLQDVFRSNRWDYPYYNKPGYGEAVERQFTVWFDGDLLVRWAGDQQPDFQPFQVPDGEIATEADIQAQSDSLTEEASATMPQAAEPPETTPSAVEPAADTIRTREETIQLNPAIDPGPDPLTPGAAPNQLAPQPLR